MSSRRNKRCLRSAGKERDVSDDDSGTNHSIPCTSTAPAPKNKQRNNFSPNFYNNISIDELESLCDRAIEYELTGTYFPPARKPISTCMNKRKKTGVRNYKPSSGRNGNTRIGQGRVGTCSYYGVTQCACCNVPERDLHSEPVLETLTPEEVNQVITTGTEAANHDEYALNSQARNRTAEPSTITQTEGIQTENNISRDITENNLGNEDIWQYINSVTESINNDEENRRVEEFDQYILTMTLNDIATSTSNAEGIDTMQQEPVETPVNDTQVSLMETAQILDESVVILESNVVPARTNNVAEAIQIIDLVEDDIPPIILPEIIVVEDCPSPVPAENEKNPDKGKVSTNFGECPVCLEDLENKQVMATMCGHIFCVRCIRNSIKKAKKCPKCRQSLTMRSIHPLFM